MTMATAGSKGACVPIGCFRGRVSLVTRSCVFVTGDHVDMSGPSSPVFAVTSATSSPGSPGSPRSPITVRTPGLRVEEWAHGRPVSIRQGRLTSGSTAIDLDALPRWTSGHVVSLTLEGIVSTIDLLQRAGGVDRVTDGSLHQGLRDVLSALSNAGSCQLREAVRRLIGCGPGLTPAGDDALVGLLMALSGVPGLHRQRLRLADCIWPELSRTTTLSACLLVLAVEGWSNEYVHDVLELAVSGPDGVPLVRHDVGEERIRRLLGYGASSGADIILGMHTGLAMARNARHGAAA
jgi:Protein of unknown function (DUF2877)